MKSVIKYINKWFTSEDLITLMKGKKNRIVTVRACLSYCTPGEKPITFSSSVVGKISKRARKTDKEESTPINEVFIPKGYDKVETQIPKNEMIKFWAKVEKYWEQLADYLQVN